VNKNVPFPGAQEADLSALREELLAQDLIKPDTIDRLLAIYGSRARLVVQLAMKDQALTERFDPNSAAIAAELVVATEFEFAETLTDVYSRRILLAFEPGHGLASARRAAELLAQSLGWSSAQIEENILEYRQWLDHLKVPELSLT
jgi:glycerol-3-phosphate dehydrogenase